MPFDGSGLFNRVHNWVTDKANNIFVTASRMDAEDDGFATGLSTCLTKNGQTTPTANIPLGGFKITGLANGVAATDAATVGQVPALAGAETFFDAGNSGVALSIDWVTNGRNQGFTLTNNTTITLGSPTTPGWFTLKVAQDATGGRTITWAGVGYSASRWIGNGAAPVLAGTASGVEYIRLFWDGTVWWMLHIGPAARRSNYVAGMSRQTSTQSVANTAQTKIQFNTADIDPYSELDVVTNNRWTPKVTGLYFVNLHALLACFVTGDVNILIKVGGVVAVQAQETSSTANIEKAIDLTYVFNATAIATGYVEAFVTFSTGSASNGVFLLSYLQVTRLGDAQ